MFTSNQMPSSFGKYRPPAALTMDHEGRDRAQAKADLRELITEFRGPEARKDIATGLRWVATALEGVIERHARNASCFR
jgi:hypothetical protein